MENFENELSKDLAKATADSAQNVVEDIVRPTSKSIGENLGLMVDGVMGWLGYWGKKQQVKREIYLNEYKKKIAQEVSEVPTEKLIEPSLRIVGPAIEASKYFIEETECRDMFAKLIGSSCNNDKANRVHPLFPEIIKQLSPLDAKFISIFCRENTYPAVEIMSYNEDGTVTPCKYVLIDFTQSGIIFTPEEQRACTKALDLLTRFGILKKNDSVLELGYDYNSFEKNWLYVAFNKGLGSSEIKMHKYRLELTLLGQDFIECCVEGNGCP